jgi:naphthalene 1,2-dioxygenase ferredoxin component
MRKTVADWKFAVELEACPIDDVRTVAISSKEYAVYRVGSEVFATASLCTHGNARLCDGFLDGYEIECPLHQGRFDIRTGAILCEPLNEPLKTFEVKVRGDSLFIDVSS